MIHRLALLLASLACVVAASLWRTGDDDDASDPSFGPSHVEGRMDASSTPHLDEPNPDSLSASASLVREALAEDEIPARPSVVGIVRDPHTLAPLAGIEVEFTASAAHPRIATVTARDGSFRFEPDPATLDRNVPARRSCELRINRTGWIGTVSLVSPHQLLAGTEVTLYASPSGLVLVRLHDAAGAPIDVSLVEIVPAGTSDAAERKTGCPLADGTASSSAATLATDEGARLRGEFEVAGLVHGRPKRLMILCSDGRGYTYELAAPSSCGEIRSVDLTIPPADSRIRGKLTRSGEPFGGVVTWRGATLAGSARAEPDGRFELIGVEPGLVTLRARDGNTTRVAVEMVDVPGDRAIEKDLDIHTSTVIRGVVRGAVGRRLRVTATARYGIDPVWFAEPQSRHREPLPVPKPDAVSDVAVDGTFEIRIRDTGTDYVLEVEARSPRDFWPEGRGYAIAAPGDQSVVLEQTPEVR